MTTKVPFSRIDIVSATEPVGAAVQLGTLWYDSSANRLKIYDGSTFQQYVETQDQIADNISVTDNFSFTNETILQDILDDVNDNIYLPLTVEHNLASGAHGPKVTITQSNADNALTIDKTSTGTGSAVFIEDSGSSAAVQIEKPGEGTALSISKDSTDAEDAVVIDNSGSASALAITHNSPGNAVTIDSTQGSGSAVRISNNDSSSIGDSLRVEQFGVGGGIRIQHENTASTNYIDIIGTDGSWLVQKNGKAFFESIHATSFSHVKFTPPTGVIPASFTNIATVTTPALSQETDCFLTPYGFFGTHVAFRFLLNGTTPVAFQGITIGRASDGQLPGLTGDVVQHLSGSIPITLPAGTHTINLQAIGDGSGFANVTHTAINGTGEGGLILWRMG